MAKEGQLENQISVRKLILFATVPSGFVAAHFTYGRGATQPHSSISDVNTGV
jgi:hypothetical protein